MIAKGVFVRDRTKDPATPTCFRLTTGVVEHTRKAVEALEALCAAFAKAAVSQTARSIATGDADQGDARRSTARAASRITPASAFSITCSTWSRATAGST